MAELKPETQQTQDTQTPPARRKQSAGEVVFNRVVYTGIGFGVNEGASLWITDQFMHGKNLFEKSPALKKAGAWFSKEGFDRISASLANAFKVTERIAQDGSKISPQARAGNSLLMATLLSGGTLLILPMKWLEDSKTFWVKKANHMIDRLRGSKMTQDEVAARDDRVEKEIACSPRQSWRSMLFGRVVAMFSSWGTGTFIVGEERNKKLMNWSEKALTGSVQEKGELNAAHRYARLASVETYSCAVSSTVQELMCKLSAKKMSVRHDPELCTPDSKAAKEAKPVGYTAKAQAQKAAQEAATAQI